MKSDEPLPKLTLRELRLSVKNYIRNHPFNSGIFALILCFVTLAFISNESPTFNQFYKENVGGFIVGWLIILGVLTGYAAKLRGRSMLWGVLFGIGLIIIAILPVWERKNEKKKLVRDPTKPNQCLYCGYEQGHQYKYCQKCSEEME
jgi:hypothetical protein